MKKLKPNGQQAKNAIISIWVVLVFEIVLLILNSYQYNLLQAITNGEVTETIDSIIDMASIIYLIAFIISAIFFIKWFSRAYSNLHQKVTGLSYSKGWAIGSWFVPILNFYRPYRIMEELYCKTETLLIERKILSDEDSLISYPVVWWWFLSIVSFFINRVLYKLKTETIEQLISYTTIYIISDIIGVLFALITIKLIKNYSKMESLLFQTDENYLDEPKEEPQENKQENELQENPIVMEKVNFEEHNQTKEEGKYDKFVFLIPIVVVIIGILIGTIINFFRQ